MSPSNESDSHISKAIFIVIFKKTMKSQIIQLFNKPKIGLRELA